MKSVVALDWHPNPTGETDIGSAPRNWNPVHGSTPRSPAQQ